MNDAKLLLDELLQGNLEFARTLVLVGADVNYVLPEGAAPIHLAAGLEWVPEDFIRLLLRHGADPNLRSSEGETPLHVSAAYGRCEFVRLFLLSGADPDILDQDGQTAAELAQQSGCEICHLTLEEFATQQDDVEDEQIAYSLEPFEPCVFDYQQLSKTEEDPQTTVQYIPDALLSNINEIYTCKSGGESGSSSKNTAANSLNSTTSFHTCDGEPMDDATFIISTTNSTDTSSQAFNVRKTQIVSSPTSPHHKSSLTTSISNNTGLTVPGFSTVRSMMTAQSAAPQETLQNPDTTYIVHSSGNDSGERLPPQGIVSGSAVCGQTQYDNKSSSGGKGLGRNVSKPEISKSSSPFKTEKTRISDPGYFPGRQHLRRNLSKPEISTTSPVSSRRKPRTSDVGILNYSPGRSLSRTPTNSPKATQSQAVLSCVNNMKEECVQEKDVGSFMKVNTKARDYLDNTLSSIGSAAFIPTDFNDSDLSLHMDPPETKADIKDVQNNGEIRVKCQHKRSEREKIVDMSETQVKLTNNTPVKKTQSDLDLWFTQMNFYNSASRECSVDIHDLPRSSSRNSSVIGNELLPDLSLSTINESHCDQHETTTTKPRFSKVPLDQKDSINSNCVYRISDSPTPTESCQHLNLDNGFLKNDPLLRHLSVDSCSSLSSRGSSVSSCSAVHYLYTDDEDGYSLIESWYPVCDVESKRSMVPVMHGCSLQHTPPCKAPSDNTVPSCVIQPSRNVPVKKETPYMVKTGGRSVSSKPKSFAKHLDSLVKGFDSLLINNSDTLIYHKTTEKQSTNNSVESLELDTKNLESGRDTTTTTKTIPDYIQELGDVALRDALIEVGITPGPINDDTRVLYQQKLYNLQQDPQTHKASADTGCLPEIHRLMTGDLDTSSLQSLEDEMIRPFTDLNPMRKWREGTRKCFFTYLLLDPRITKNLPTRVKIIGEVEAFRDFIKAIFYVGKGTRARPYAHFKEAIQHKTGVKTKSPGEKVQRIMDIWSDGNGVISLHVFQNVIAVEAYTREAAMIDAIGRKKVTNIKGGEYYGASASWTAQQKRALGARLLHKSFRIFLSEGERHIRPADIQGS